VIGFLIQLR